ncbi:DNA-directed RNA polymerase subunit beta [Nocardia abscessus]|uniref:DNA-directed RNA polymerase subunit beta n=1 Tax=Nocardia abscessus TaxID=120957 RepID=UPI0024549595|nr:DNA-directed RNA polymerase subunit beta [Nocardia abscessus]
MDDEPFGDTPVSRCEFYRRKCGLPAVIDPPEIGRIIVRAGSVWGVTMPIRLGQRVKAHLHSGGNQPGPIIAHPRSGRWTFLVDPDIPAVDMDRYAELFRWDVSIADTGSMIALPSPSPGGAIRHWIIPPRNAFRSSGRDVLTALRVWRDDKPVHHDR